MKILIALLIVIPNELDMTTVEKHNAHNVKPQEYPTCVYGYLCVVVFNMRALIVVACVGLACELLRVALVVLLDLSNSYGQFTIVFVFSFEHYATQTPLPMLVLGFRHFLLHWRFLSARGGVGLTRWSRSGNGASGMWTMENTL